MVLVGALLVGGQDVLNVLLGEFIAVGDLYALFGSVDKEGGVFRFGFFEDQDTGGNGGAEEEVVRELDDAVDEVVVDEILADFLFRPAPIHDTREADDGRCAVCSQPGEGVHDESQVCLGLGGQHTSGSKTGIIDEGSVVVPFPLDGIGRVC